MTEEISVQQIFIATIITRVKLWSASPYTPKNREEIRRTAELQSSPVGKKATIEIQRGKQSISYQIRPLRWTHSGLPGSGEEVPTHQGYQEILLLKERLNPSRT
jgi:hypothetical protein